MVIMKFIRNDVKIKETDLASGFLKLQLCCGLWPTPMVKPLCTPAWPAYQVEWTCTITVTVVQFLCSWACRQSRYLLTHCPHASSWYWCSQDNDTNKNAKADWLHRAIGTSVYVLIYLNACRHHEGLYMHAMLHHWRSTLAYRTYIVHDHLSPCMQSKAHIVLRV